MKFIRNFSIYGLPTTLAVAAIPYIVNAQGSGGPVGIFAIINQLTTIIQRIVPLLIGIAVLMFLWGILKYVIAKDEDSQKEARNTMLWGIITIFVMVSVWGLINILVDSFAFNKTATAPNIIPTPINAPTNGS